MAQAVADGAATEPGIHTQLLHASETTAEHVLNAYGYVFISPETLGKLTGRPYAVLVCAALASGLALGLF